MNKLIEFFNKDINDKNELKKTVVATRQVCLLMILYMILFFAASIIAGSYRSTGLFLLMIFGNIIAMHMTYGRDIQKACIAVDVIAVLSVVSTVVRFGWDSGIQHFLFALVVYNILFVRISARAQIVGACLICMLRLALYFYCRFFDAKFTFSDTMAMFVQIISTIFVFMVIIVCAINYAIENQNTENAIRKYNKDLERLASTDPLTKLWNRHKMLEYINEYLKEHREFCSVSICDIDHFKYINDTYGHEGGDKVLVAIAELFQRQMTDVGAVARWGGEEFLIFFEGMNGDDAKIKLYDMHVKLKDMIIPYYGADLKVTMTYGLVEFNKSLSIDDNIKIADDRLYYGKEHGRDQIVY